jgi:IS5 family transposase
LIGNRGRIVDASFVDVPKQRNSREENLQVKNGQVPEEWKEKPNMLAQKDVEARWTKKNNEVHFGYKNNIKADTKSKMIMEYKTTSANVHDSQAVKDLLNKKDDKGCCFYADSAYIGHYINALVARIKMIARICKKGFRNRPLTEAQKRFNKLKSHVRVRVEHIFGFQTNSMDASCIRTIGIERADTVIGLNNLTYNMFRFLQIT